MPDNNNVGAFKAKLHGELIQPNDAGYDEARKIYNGMIDKRPRMIAYCADVADVQTAVRFGRENEILTAIRGGGHNGGGLGLCDDGLVIDLSKMTDIAIDPAARTVRVGGGCTWNDVDTATHEHGLAVPAGTISTTGVAGLTLGGGVGHLTRRYGLTIDSLLAADMVLADGSTVTASAEENEDLYWAIRGGGGNFGVVTSFLFRAHPVHTNYAGPTFWEVDRAAEVLSWYREFILQAPEELGGFFAFLVVPGADPFPEHLHGKKMCGVIWCYTGPLENAEEVFKPIRAFGPPAFDGVGPMPHPTMQSMFDVFYPSGLQWYWRADFMNEISDAAIAEHARFGAQIPTGHSTMHIYPIDGAAHRMSNSDTPWAYRESNFAQVIVGVDPDPANNDKIIGWTKSYFDALHPHSAGGAYVNFMMEEGQERVRATYRDNYARLAQIKKQYDPDNLFRVNQNIEPAG
jgi:UDP-N-acetylenolpyruvoylglucosamine reductase